MIDLITRFYNTSDYDFRVYAYPKDELSYLFTEWVPNYRLKYAICKAINPQSILDVGSRYGYSAITFLKASEKATYLGINNYLNSFDRSKGAIEWTKKITSGYNADFLIADTKKMMKFPGDFYDLIHIEGQKDGDGTLHDLILSLDKGRWILLDGYFRSKENMLSATYFLEKYKQFVDYAIIIPSDVGNLLIKTKASAKNIQIFSKNYSDQTIREEYDQNYFFYDCGGYDSFKKYQGKQLTEDRLLAALYLANPNRNTSILDIGCGRGELCNALAQSGAYVVGIDYSRSAISIAENTFQSAIKKDKLEFICDDFLQFKFDKKFDRIIATDFIEHIEYNRFDQAIRKVAGLLKPEGLFILHTSPNALNYGAPYEEKREIARSIGSFLPKNPRTYYEDVMHINEQTPDSLTKSLKKYFPHTIVWVATTSDIVGSLARTFSTNETLNAQSIFAVASNSSLDPARIIHQLIQNPLDANKLNAKISVQSYPKIVAPDEHFSVEIILDNLSCERWVSLLPNPVYLSYHWLNDKGTYVVFDGIRTSIRYPLSPGESQDFSLNVVAPKINGEYVLQVTLVQESCFWLETVVQNLPISLMIKTKADE